MARLEVFESLMVGALQENCYLVGDPVTCAAVCIDPGDEAPRILDAARRHNLTNEAILLTHTHFDHVGALADVAAATSAPVVAPDGEQAMLGMAAEMAAFWGLLIPTPPQPDQWIQPGEAVEWRGIRFDVLDVRGHSPAGIAFSADGMVFSGDALFAGNIGRTDLPGGDHATLIDSVRRNLLTLPGDTVVYPGHGPFTTIAREIRDNPFLNI